jgi:long-chain acyl-CoA synthetase
MYNFPMSNPISDSKTICEAYVRRVKSEGDRVGFRYKKEGKWKEVTFAEHFQNSKRLACGLLQLGLKRGDRVNIVAQTSIYWSQFDMAILCAGGITVPVYPTNTPEDTAYIINHCESEILFVDDFKNLQKLAEISGKCSKLKKVIVNFQVRSGDIKASFEIIHWNTLFDLGLNNESTHSLRVEGTMKEIRPEDIFTICYTSGTTGVPKGVVLTHSAVRSVMVDVEKVMMAHVTNKEELLTFLPMSHIFGKWESLTPYYLGWCCNFAESLDTLVANLSEVRPTLWVAVPRIFEKVYVKIQTQVEQGSAAKRALFNWAVDVGKQVVELEAKGKKPGLPLLLQYETAKRLVFAKISQRFGGRLKFCVSGSAPLAPEIQLFMHAVGVPVFEGYGLTETCAPVCVNLPGSNKFGTVGKIFSEVLVRIAEDGEILIKSEKNFKEYYKNPEATAEAIKDGWFYTGDIGNIDSEGYLRITDRKKDLIKTAGGKFIAPQKIENIAKSQKILSQIVVYGDQKPFAVALITLNQELVIQYAQSQKILYDEYADLLKNPEMVRKVNETMEAINAQLAKYETIKKYILLPKEFTVEDGDLTPSLKIKRKQICQKYKKDLEALYSENH